MPTCVSPSGDAPPTTTPTSPLDRATTLVGGRVRIPTAMIADGRSYSALAIGLYSLIEKLDDRTNPAYAGRAWYAQKLCTSVASIARALKQLCASSSGGTNQFPRVASFQLSMYRTADRWTVHVEGDTYVQVPAWVLALVEHGALSHKGLRLYAGYLALRARRRLSVRATNAELAAASGVGLDSVAALRRECEAAGLLLVLDEGRGRPSTVVPLLARTTADERVALLIDALAACGQLRRDGTARPVELSTAAPETETAGTPESETPPSSKTHGEGSNRERPSQGLWTSAVVSALKWVASRQARRVRVRNRRRELEVADRLHAPPPPSWRTTFAWWDEEHRSGASWPFSGSGFVPARPTWEPT